MPDDLPGNFTATIPGTRRLFTGWLRALILFGLLLALAAWYYFWLDRPIGHGPAGPKVPGGAFHHPWTTRPVLLVGLGDSVTAGFGARKGYSYFDLLAANPPVESSELRGLNLTSVLPNLQITNLAISGSTSFEHLEKEIPRLPTMNSNVLGLIVITTGGNDLIHNYGRTPPTERAMYGATLEEATPWIAGFEARLENMFTRLELAFPGGCQIFLADIFDPTDGEGDIQHAGLPAWKDGMKIFNAYNAVIHRFAGRHRQVHVIPVHDLFLGHGIHCTQFWSGHYDRAEPHYWYYENLEDPNERGYDAIRRLFLIEMEKASTGIE